MSDPGTATVHLVRHGEVHNPGRVLYGRLPDFHLSDRGRAQAELTARWLVDRYGERLVQLRCSPLERARETAAPLAKATGLTPVIDERLVEAANALEGHRMTGAVDLARAMARPANWRLFRNPVRPSWGEPYQQVADRVYAAVRSAYSDVVAAGGGDAVCVSHQLPVYVTRLFLTGRSLPHSPRRRECALASVTSVTLAGPPANPAVVDVQYHEPAGRSSAHQPPGA